LVVLCYVVLCCVGFGQRILDSGGYLEEGTQGLYTG
jgi:hypothetical protein